MQIRSLTAFEVPIRLKKPIRHASHVRIGNETLIVRCELADGSVGWGEGLPRTYVTGESMSSVWRHLTATDFTPLADAVMADVPAAVRVLDGFRLAEVPADQGVPPRECFGNSVRCALELSLLDAVCCGVGQALGDLVFQLPEVAAVAERLDHVHYSGVVTSVSPAKQWLSAFRMKIFGFRQVKVKVGTDGIDDAACLSRLRARLAPDVDLRLDANEAWHLDSLVDHVRPLLPFGLSSLEQPVPHAEVSGLADVRKELGVPLMLDESLCCLEDAQRAIEQQTCDLFNLRLSKCGGFVSCLRLAAMAEQHGIGCQLGCQVGETGILSAAGRHFACNVGGIRYLEGSYDRFLVRDRLTKQDLTIRYGGFGPRLSGPGLGVTVDEGRVRAMAVRNETIFCR